PPRRLNPRVPKKLEQICLRCLEKVPQERYPSAQALAENLERFLDGEEVETGRSGPGQELRRWARREPALVARLGALAVCGVVIQANYSISGQVEPAFHWTVMATLGVWGLVTLSFRWLLSHAQRPGAIPFAWATADVVLLTVLLRIDDSLGTAFLIGY